jgi:hypothetical protein
MTAVDMLLQKLSECPPGPHAQIDDAITPLLRELVGKPPAEQAFELKKILDECAYSALASDFAMSAMMLTWQMAAKIGEASEDS